jgi:hypothetical protein
MFKGRNLKTCINFWDTLHAGPSYSLPPAPERKRKSEGLEPLHAAPKRRQSGADNMIRIQPKPSSNGSPLSFSTTPATQPKKRGRPSKAEVEKRNAAAVARGEVIMPRTTVARESMGGEVSTEAAVSSTGFGGLPAIAPMVPTGPSSSFQTGPSEAETGDLANKMKKRGRPGSRSSKEPGEGSFSSFGPHSGQFEAVPMQPATNAPPKEPSETPALPPRPKTEEEGIAAPGYPAIDSLLSPHPYPPGRSSTQH